MPSPNNGADLIARRLAEISVRISAISWSIDQVLFKLRVSAVGSSGIQHRIIEEEETLHLRMNEVLIAAEHAVHQIIPDLAAVFGVKKDTWP